MSSNNFKNSRVITRRNFLRTMGGCAAMSQTALLSTLLNLSLTKSAAAATNTSGYKAMVCVFLFGGIDSYNMLVPADGDADSGPYVDYRNARSSLALDKGALHSILDSADSRSYGLHPGLSELQQLYTQGKLTFVANVGSLIEPVNQGNYASGARLPLGLFSHSDQQQHWQTSIPQSRTQVTGWLGRAADVLTDSVNTNPFISMNIALERLNILQTGNTILPYVVDDSTGATSLIGYGNSGSVDRILTGATDNLLDQKYRDLLKQTHADVRRQSIDAAVAYNEATADVLPGTGDSQIGPAIAVLNSSALGKQLMQVAKAISARENLGQKRQIFFTSMGGWDHHANLLSRQANSLPKVSKSLKAFYEVTEYLGIANDVVTFTASDFGRTLNANTNSGTDHAWAGNHIVMGGAVAGNRLHGSYPVSLAPGNALDIGRGRLIPTTSVDEYAATLAMWFGIDNGATLESILPNIRNFYSSTATAPPLGFLG